MQTDRLEFLRKLVATPTPTGFEDGGMRLLAASLRDAGVQNLRIDRHGNLVSVLNPDAPVRVMLEGHCDEIGFIVQYIDEDGFLYMAALGGVTVPTVASERVVIQGRDGPVNGVFGCRPPHLMTAEERRKVAPAELRDIAVDIGAKDREEALRLVELGAPAVVDAGWRELAGSNVSCRGFDNRIGSFIVNEATRRLAKEKLNVALYSVASVQEEIGLIGGYTTANDIAPQIGLCVDVGHATDANKKDRRVCGDIRLGGGPVVGLGPVYHRGLVRRIDDAAQRIGVTLQHRVNARGTGTCAYAMRLTGEGAAVAQFSVPLRYMHSPVEVINLDDAMQTVEVIVETVKSLPADIDLCPPQP